jgi:hypothetical protein
VRFTIPVDEEVTGLEMTRRIYLALREEVSSALRLLFLSLPLSTLLTTITGLLQPLNTIIAGRRGPLQPDRTYRRRSVIASASAAHAEHEVSSDLTNSPKCTNILRPSS